MKMGVLKTVVIVIVIGLFDLGSGANVFSNPVALHSLFELDAQIAAAIRLVFEVNEIEVSRVGAAER